MKVPCWAVGVGGSSDDAEEEQEGKGPRCVRATAGWSSSSSHAAGACAVVVRWQGVSKKEAGLKERWRVLLLLLQRATSDLPPKCQHGSATLSLHSAAFQSTASQRNNIHSIHHM